MLQAHYSSNSSFIPTTSGHRIPDQASWFLDSGATNHVTSQLGNLTLQQDYYGKGKTAVGNGSLLNISHIGDSLIQVPATRSQTSFMYHKLQRIF